MAFSWDKLQWRPSRFSRDVESRKPVIQRSFWLALKRGLIHVFPVVIATSLVAINWVGVYIGPNLDYRNWWTTTNTLAMFQGAAKAQVFIPNPFLCVVSFSMAKRGEGGLGDS